MFGRKSAQPTPQYAVQILTLDYLLAGFLHPDDVDLFADEDDDNMFRLSSVQMQPVGVLAAPTLSLAQCSISSREGFVGAVPFNDASMQLMQDYLSDYSNRFPLDVYVGPFVIHGMVLSSDPQSPVDDPLVIADARIDHLSPGARLKNFEAPVILIHTNLEVIYAG